MQFLYNFLCCVPTNMQLCHHTPKERSQFVEYVDSETLKHRLNTVYTTLQWYPCFTIIQIPITCFNFSISSPYSSKILKSTMSVIAASMRSKGCGECWFWNCILEWGIAQSLDSLNGLLDQCFPNFFSGDPYFKSGKPSRP